MATVEKNLQLWTNHPWPQEGAEWTTGFGGPDMAWECAIWPRIRAFMPADHILEIGPGYGLWTSWLRKHSKRMTVVDLTPRCIEACRRKFGRWRMTYIVNDGSSLAEVPDNSVDFVFSWHSLVHCDHEVMTAYVSQLATKLRPGAAGLIQHSNLGIYRDPQTGELTRPSYDFGSDMTAVKFQEDCARAGLHLLYQEVVTYVVEHNTCISLIRKPLPGQVAPPFDGALVNDGFWDEVRGYGRALKAYQYPPQKLEVS